MSCFSCTDVCRRKLGGFKWRKTGLPTVAENVEDTIWTTANWAVNDGEVLVMRAIRAVLDWRTTTRWRNRSVGHEEGRGERDKMEVQIRIPQQRSAMAYSGA